MSFDMARQFLLQHLLEHLDLDFPIYYLICLNILIALTTLEEYQAKKQSETWQHHFDGLLSSDATSCLRLASNV